jgi:hypothetical protein
MICDHVHITLTILFGLFDPILTNPRKQFVNNVENDEIKLSDTNNLMAQCYYMLLFTVNHEYIQGLIMISAQTQIPVFSQTWK